LAKNPAGWAEALKLVNINANPVIFAVNAEIPDGKDTSWLYDVPFEVINSKFVLATGKRVLDLAARLAYADADYEVVSHYDEIFKNSKFVDYINADANMKRIDLVANYSAFQDLLKVDF
jgi:UDP-N-acetylmuramyl tripeptide synthase